MDEKNATLNENRTRSERRWHRDTDGAFYYRGRCPFNTALCKMLNCRAGAKKDHWGDEHGVR
jgi:hypothetical protein